VEGRVLVAPFTLSFLRGWYLGKISVGDLCLRLSQEVCLKLRAVGPCKAAQKFRTWSLGMKAMSAEMETELFADPIIAEVSQMFVDYEGSGQKKGSP